MCGGAIIVDLLQHLKQPGLGDQLSKPVKTDMIDIDDDLEIDFQHFSGASDLEIDVKKLVDVHPSAPASQLSKCPSCGLPRVNKLETVFLSSKF